MLGRRDKCCCKPNLNLRGGFSKLKNLQKLSICCLVTGAEIQTQYHKVAYTITRPGLLASWLASNFRQDFSAIKPVLQLQRYKSVLGCN